MKDSLFWVCDELSGCVDLSRIRSYVSRSRSLHPQLRVALSKYRIWSSGSYLDLHGRLRVLRGLCGLLCGARIGVIGRNSYGLVWGSWTITLNRYCVVVLLGDSMVYRFSSDNENGWWLLPFYLQLSSYGE